jgi:hypothetical protein
VTSLVLLVGVTPLGTASASAQGAGPHVDRGGEHVLSRSAEAKFTHPSGQRMRAGKSSNEWRSTNWSGLVLPSSGIEGAEADWTVPAVQPSSSSLYSSTWVGVDGFSNDELIQTGTSQDTGDGYDAWFEMLPASETEITNGSGNPAAVEPGDEMVADVEEDSANVWTIFLDDETENWYFDQSYDYFAPGLSAEWIEEAPRIDGSISSLADFGTSTFTETAVYGDLGSSGTTWYGTDMDASNEVEMVNATQTVLLAAPAAPTPDPSGGQDFTDTYEGTPIVPPRAPTVAVSSPRHKFQLSSVITVQYSATDSQSPPARYEVRYESAPWNSQFFSEYVYPANWQLIAGQRQTLIGVPGSEYCFDVRAIAEDGAASAWTSGTCTTLPLGESSLRPTPAPDWIRHRAVGNYLSSFVSTGTMGATLVVSGAWANQVAIIATKCPSCGALDVFVNGAFLGRIKTQSAIVDPHAFFTLPTFSSGKVAIELEDTSRHGRVIVNGVDIN